MTPRDTFLCLPLACVLSARACVERQRETHITGTRTGSLTTFAAYPSCRRCTLGRAIAAAVDVPVRVRRPRVLERARKGLCHAP